MLPALERAQVSRVAVEPLADPHPGPGLFWILRLSTGDSHGSRAH